MHMDRVIWPANIIAATASTASWLINTHEVVKVAVTIVALLAGIVGLLASWETRKLRRTERRKMEAAGALELANLCERCRAGHPPPVCPLPKIDRPSDCPHPELK